MASDLLEGVEFTGPSTDLLEGVQVGGEPYRPRRDMGFFESAGKTAAQATIPVVRAIDMAAAGVAGAFERIFPQLAGEQDRIFQMMQERNQRMTEAYTPAPEEQVSLPGAVAGGIASLPVEMAGGFGAQHGIERTAQVLERGGTGGQAALAGGVTGATRVGLNLLPVKLGGKIGGAVEGRLGAMLGGAATGAAVNVPGEALGVAAENLALPAAEDATLAQRARGEGLAPGMEGLGQDPLDPANLAVSAGLSGALGAVGGATAKKAPPKKGKAPPLPPEFKPMDGGEFKAPNGATITQEQWDNASDRVRQGWMKAPAPKAPEEKIPTGEATEIPMDEAKATPPEPAGETARRAEIKRLMDETTSDQVRAVLKKELAALDKTKKARDLEAGKAADRAELLAAAAKTDDPEVKAALLKQADQVMPPPKDLPTGEAKEVEVETVEPAPEPIPAGEAVEVDVETVEPDAPRETAAPQQKEEAPSEAVPVEKVPVEKPPVEAEKAAPAPSEPADARPPDGRPRRRELPPLTPEQRRLLTTKPVALHKFEATNPTEAQREARRVEISKWNAAWRAEKEKAYAAQAQSQQGGVQPERVPGGEGRQAPEAGRGDSVQRAAPRQEGQAPAEGQGQKVAPGRGRELGPKETEITAVAGAVDPNAVTVLRNKAGPVTVGKLKIPRQAVRTPEAAAQALAPMRRDTQEHFLALVTDNNDAPLAVIRHAKGGPAQTSVYPQSLLSAVAQVKGGKNVWFAHNHPSGMTIPSRADEMVQKGLQETLRGSGMNVRAHTIIGPGGKTSHFELSRTGAVENIPAVRPIKPSLRKAEVPIQETRFIGFKKGEEDTLNSPAQARSLVGRRLKNDESGLVLMDAQLTPVGVLPMTDAEMAKLRTGDTETGVMKVLRALGDVNASAAFIKVGPGTKGEFNNLNAALNALDIRVVDIFRSDKQGVLHSMAEKGDSLEPPTGKSFQSVGENDKRLPRTRLLQSEDELDQVLRAKFGSKLIDALQEQGILHYLSGDKDVPDRPYTKGRLIERSDNTSHARLYWDRMTADEAPTVLMHEIGEHFGIIRLLGDDRYRMLLGELAEMNRSGDAEVRRAWETVKQRYVGASYLEEGSPQFVREVAARLVESAPDMPWVRRLLAEIRSWLYQQFGTTLGNRADATLIRGLAWSALKKAGEGELPRQDRFVYPDFMRSAKPVTEFDQAMQGEPSYGGSPPRAPPLGDEDKAELVTRKLFDRFNRVLRVQKATGITDEDKDIYLADTLYQGRVQHEGDKLQRDYIEPLGKLLKEAKQEDLTTKDADDYLMALHAPERNRVIAARNDKMPDGGSGLTDQQAADIIDSFTPAQRDYLDKVATIVHRLNREKLQRMVESGLITPETRDTLNRQYRNYVPLKTLDEEDAAMGTGRGYELRASDITTAMGRKSKAGSPIAASIMDASRVIIRSEKARVDRTIWNFANDAAADPFMRPYDPDNPPATVMSRKIGPDGNVKDVVDTQKVLDQTISLMVDGEARRIFVDDELLREQIRKVATLNDPGAVLRAIGRGTGAIGRMLTEFNPAFTIPNAVRDAWTVGLRAPAHGISRWKAVSGIPRAWASIVAYKRGANTPGAKSYEEFQEVGGKIGAYGIQNVADTMRRLENAGAELGYDEQKGGLSRKGMKVLRDVAFVFSQANEVFEYATRLSAYEQARAAGNSPKRAAAIAKDITVNFNRSGEYGRVMNSLLVFANAALQGLYGTLRYAKDPKVQRGMLGMVALGIASQAWNELMGGVNEETGEPNANTQNDSIMDKNMVALLPESKSGFKIPLPQEYAALYAMGRRLYRGASQGDWGKEAAGVAGALIDASLPVRLPEASSLALSGGKALVPTLAAPFVDLWTNENYFGAPVYVEQRDTSSPAPYYTLTRPQTSVLAKEVSEMLNTVTGGDEIEPGWSQRAAGPVVAPEGIEHLVGFYTGGAGQFVLQSANMAKQLAGDPDAMELNRTPIVNRFVFNEPTSYIGRRYRELEGQLEYARDRMKAGQEISNEKLERALPVFEETERELSRLRKEMRAAANAGEPVEELRKQGRAAQSRVIRAFNGQSLQ